MLTSFFLLIGGFMLLVKGADYLVGGSSAIARRLGIKPIIIGLTLVAFGTSTPELVVNIVSVLGGKPEIAVGNILGSNIVNILLILGISAFIFPLIVDRRSAWRGIPLAMVSSVLPLLLATNFFTLPSGTHVLSRIDGAILFAFFLYFLYDTREAARGMVGEEEEVPHNVSRLSRNILFSVMGLFGLVVGGKLVVDGAVAIAQSFGMPESIIALTIVAIGTSLPELVTSVVAAYKKEADIAVGNIIGSNIFNVFLILGVSSLIAPLPFSTDAVTDLLMTLAATVLFFVAVFVGRRYTLERWQGIAFVGVYVAYIWFLLTTRV